MNRSLATFLAAVVLAAGSSAPRAATAPELKLSKPPLFLNAAVDPNLLVTFDDSGSMDNGYVPDAIGSTCAWRHKRYYSSAWNKQYYDPNISYEPPLDASGAELVNSVFSNASVNGFDSAASKVDLGGSYFVSWEEQSTPQRIAYEKDATSTRTCGTPRTYDFPSGGAKAFYCTLKAGGTPSVDADYTCTTVATADQANFANWFTYYRIRGNTLKSAISRSFGTLDDDLRVAWQNMNKDQLVDATTIGRFTGTRRLNFFDFLFKSPYDSNTPTLDATIRAGRFFERKTAKSETNPYWDETLGKELSCRQNFHVLVSDGYWNQDPNHPAGASKATLINRDLPDKRKFVASSSGDGAYAKIIWNEDARQFNCTTLKDKDDNGIGECSPSYADMSFDYWARDLRGDLDNNVPSYLPDRSTGVTGSAVDITKVKDLRDVPEIYWNPANDPATWQHMVQFFIGFGISGKLAYNDATLKDLRTGKTKWTGAKNNAEESVDDSWHAALASRGKYFGATDPNQIVDALTDILSSIVQRKGTASALSVSTGIVTGETLSYQTQFDSTDWSGTVLGRKVGKDFAFADKATWDASCILTGGDCATTGTTEVARPDWNTGRRMFTAKAGTGAGVGVPFRWASLSTAQQTALNRNPTTGKADTLGDKRLEYLRGDRSKERQNGGAFRNRASLFGAVVSSSANYIGPPRQRFDIDWPTGSEEAKAVAAGNGYKKFAADNKSRVGMVAVGANDGMMHLLDATTGVELLAYVPSGVYKTLDKLTDPLYQFDPTVDSMPVVGDAFIKGQWRTIAVGTLRRGGQGAFAIDVTNPTATDADAGSRVLWDLTDSATDAADLGYTYGQPFITRLAYGKWVALLPAGYNSQEADGVAGTGNAVLFVIDLENGNIEKKIDLGAIDPDARGLATPVAIDLNADEISEVAYAGDLAGNIWRFDLGGTAKSMWGASRLFQPEKAFDRPITAQPRVLRDENNGLPVVYVGTGKFIETGDRTTAIPTQAFYGIRDDGSTVGVSDLAGRTVTSTATTRKVANDPAQPGSGKGFMIKFSEIAGERVVAAASLRVVANEVIFSTLIPAGEDPCTPGGSSFLMFVDGSTGGAASDNVAYFDVNGDGKIDSADDAQVVGKKIESLVPGVASILQQGGGVGAILLPPAPGDDKLSKVITREFEWRRRSWRELFRQN